MRARRARSTQSLALAVGRSARSCVARQVVLVVGCLVGFAGVASAVPTSSVHSLDWYVHQCLVDANGLAFYQNLLDARQRESDRLLEGEHGPADSGCCVSLAAATVSAFGTCGDGLDNLTSQSELSSIWAMSPGAYLVETVHFCGMSASTSIRGCALSPGDHMIVGRESEDSLFLPEVIAHERGHNAGLGHVIANPCELMSSSSGGGCLSVAECNAFITKADTTGPTCECLPDLVGDPAVPDGTVCVDTGGCERCAGGTCATCSEGSVRRLWTAGGVGASSGNPSDDAIEQNFVTGGWSSAGGFGSGIQVDGLAYDSVRDVLFGIETQPGDELLVTLDPLTGMRTGTVGTIPFDNVVALAFDPTADLLYAAHVDAEIFGGPFDCMGSVGTAVCVTEILQIDPDTAATTALGELNGFIVNDGTSGMAFDTRRETLYISTGFGLASVGLGSCNGSTCPVNQIDNTFRVPSTLAYDQLSDQLIRQGGVLGRTEIDLIDAATGLVTSDTGIDPFTAGGSVVVPEPGGLLGWGLAALTLLAWRRGRR